MTHTTPAKAIFLAARDLADPAERAKYLESACGGDLELRQRVEQLLQASAQTGDFLSGTAEVERGLQPSLGERIGYFGDYVLLDEIARGASGVVFRARQSSLDRVVALKMLRGHALAEGDDGLRRFKAEAQAAAGLKHANLVPIYEVGEFEGQGYYSMPLIEGGTLISRAGEYREPRKAVALMVKVARAIQAAHEAGLLHRDIKPGNVLIDPEGEPQVTDFGIARKMGMDSDLTVTGQIMGTPHYMSPEQARGETQGLTAAADVYGLGAVLYELLTGEKPFSGDSMIEVLKKVAEEPPKAPRGIERDLSVIVMKCLEKAPSARYATAAALADDLEKWLRGEPITARPAGRVERVVKWVRRSPYKAALVALAGLCLISWGLFVMLVSAGWFTAAELVNAPRLNYQPISSREPVDVLAWLSLSKDGAVWSKSEGVLTGTPREASNRVYLALPLLSPNDYDLSMGFRVDASTRGGLDENPMWVIQVGNHRLQFVLGIESQCKCARCMVGGTGKPIAVVGGVEHPLAPMSGLLLIQAKRPAKNGTGVFQHRLQSGEWHVIHFRVRRDGENASVEVELDGKLLTKWQGFVADLSVEPAVKNNDAVHSFGLFTAYGCRAQFRQIRFTPVKGEAWIAVDKK